MQQLTRVSLEETITLVDEARRQIEVEFTALGRLLREGSIESSDYTKRQGELREEKAKQLHSQVEEALAQSYTGPQLKQSHYLKAAYDHLLTGHATIEAFSWKRAQRAAQLHTEQACREEQNRERELINQEAQALTKTDLFPG